MAQMNNFKAEINDNVVKNIQIETKIPKKILHFSDGVMECYSDDDDENQNQMDNTKVDNVDTSKLTWGPWLTHKAASTGQTVLGACDYAGETLAYYLGITTPKYQFEIEEYERIKQKEKKEAEMTKGWVNCQVGDTMIQQPQQQDQAATIV